MYNVSTDLKFVNQFLKNKKEKKIRLSLEEYLYFDVCAFK